jgi:putative N-acetylmannosamine-6-phosphate epimerase
VIITPVFKKGLIVSIQGFSQKTTQELANIAKDNGAVGIRTDQPINTDLFVIGLKKLPGKDYYITTSKDAIIDVSKWTSNIAIDSRKGNQEIEFLYAVCHMMNINIIADIKDIADVRNIIEMCENKKIALPRYFATTFNFDSLQKWKIIDEIKKIISIPIIAEGGYSEFHEIEFAYYLGANNVCIGNSIMGIDKKIKQYAGII